MGTIILAYLGLFGGAFVAATLIPFPSEGLLLGYLDMGYPVWTCIAIATIGNTAGGLTNYAIGRFGNSLQLLKRFKLNEDKLKKWYAHSTKWGHYLGLLAWIPVIGDPMIVALGYFKVKFWPLAFFVLLGKLIRYVIVAQMYISMQ